MKTALFLGAGASVCFGKPTTKELLEKLSTRFESDPFITYILNDRKSFPDVEYLYTAINDLIDLEHSPGSALINSKYPLNSNLTFNELLSKLKQLQSDIRDLILNSYSVDQSQAKFIEPIYHPISNFLKETGSEYFQVITTNYDDVIDVFTSSNGNNNIVDGFGKTHDRHTSSWQNTFKPLNNDSIYLIKLHGSITWYQNNGNIFQTGGVTRRDEKDDVMIAPTLTGKNYDREPFYSLIKQFQKILGEIDVLIVIGFSFRDTELTKMMKDAVKSKNLTIISISPTSSKDIVKYLKVTPITFGPIIRISQIRTGSYYSFDIEFRHEFLNKILKNLDFLYRSISSSTRHDKPHNSP